MYIVFEEDNMVLAPLLFVPTFSFAQFHEALLNVFAAATSRAEEVHNNKGVWTGFLQVMLELSLTVDLFHLQQQFESS